MAFIKNILQGFLGLKKDPNATTQDTAVIKAEDTNSSIAIVPNGTGAFTLDVPDGTATGGNARGDYAVDLQRVRSSADQVASGNYSIIVGGSSNLIASGTSIYNAIVGGFNNQILSNVTNRSYNYIGGGIRNIINDVGNGNSNTISGGFENTITGERSVIGGGINNVHNNSSYSTISGGRQNTSSSAYNTISGGQQNTASTNTYATVVGGYQNSSTGQYSVSGGYNNVASGYGSVALGFDNTASGDRSISVGGRSNDSTGQFSFTTGQSNNVSGQNSFAFGWNHNVSAIRGGVLTGYSSSVSGNDSLAIGTGQIVNSGSSLAINSYNECSASSSFASGTGSKTYMYTQNSHSSGKFSATGDAQESIVLSRKEDTLTTGATTELFINNLNFKIIPDGNNRVWNVTIKYSAVVTSITGTATGVSVGDCKNEVLTIGFKKIGGTSSVVGSLNTVSTNEDSSMSTASFGVSAGASQEMKLDFTNATFIGGGSLTVRVVAKVELTECAY